jgi:predicted RNA-binding Zn-ribbon protein involved in translation (DUF1610 family)
MEKIVSGSEKITCKSCGQMMTLKEGFSEKINPKTGKAFGAYKVWRCDDKNCKNAEFVHSDKVKKEPEAPSIKKLYNETVAPSAQIKPKETSEQEMWAKKEKREHKRALTMQAFGLFPPRTNEDGTTPKDRWLAIKDMRDIMLTDLYCD